MKSLRASKSWDILESKTLPTSFSTELLVQTKLKFIESKTIGVWSMIIDDEIIILVDS